MLDDMLREFCSPQMHKMTKLCTALLVSYFAATILTAILPGDARFKKNCKTAMLAGMAIGAVMIAFGIQVSDLMVLITK